MKKILSFFKRRKQTKQRKKLLSDVRSGLHQDDDLLTEDQHHRLNELIAEIESASPDRMKALEEKFFQIARYNTFRHGMQSFLDVILVALTVAFGIRALFLQPFQIPTGSMQPTLFGVHYIDRVESASWIGPLSKLYLNVFSKTIRAEVVDASGSVQLTGGVKSLEDLSAAERYLDSSTMAKLYTPGSVLCDGWLCTGDHLFVDRVSLHFKPLTRGEIFIFNTEGIIDPRTHQPLPGFFYIKRMVGLPGDTLKIVNNVLMIRPQGENAFRPATDFSARFNRIYSGKGGYMGHVPEGCLADGEEFTVPVDSFFAMGDNSRNSLDSRYWGAVPRRNVIGRALNVFWPVSRRYGLVDEKDALDVPSGIPNSDRPDSQMPAMRLQ